MRKPALGRRLDHRVPFADPEHHGLNRVRS
jgi:hypothetical protein